MFCYQCEQAAQGSGCTKIGVCGKQPEVAALQDLLVYGLKGIAFWANEARKAGKKDPEIDRFMIEGLFTTVTNVDFDAEAIAGILRKAATIRAKAQALAGPIAAEAPDAARWQAAADTAGLVAAGRGSRRQERRHRPGRQVGPGDPHLRHQGLCRLRRPRPHPRRGERRRSTPSPTRRWPPLSTPAWV